MTKTQKAHYENLGREAYLAGKANIPTADSEVWAAIENLPVGGGAAQIMKAWVKGWTDANIADQSWKD